MKNPCRDCPNLPEDKNGPRCQGCPDRVTYVRSFGSMSDMQPFVNGAGTNGVKPPVGAGYDAGADEMRYKTCCGPLCIRLDPVGVERPLTEFRMNPSCKDGRLGVCRKCESWKYQNRKKEITMEKQPEFKFNATKFCKGYVCLTFDPEGMARSISKFGPSKNAKDGHNAKCRMCTAYDYVYRMAKQKDAVAPDPAEYAKKYKWKEPGESKDKAPAKPAASPTPNRYKKGPKAESTKIVPKLSESALAALNTSKVIPASSPVIPAKAGNQKKPISAKERLKNHFVKMMDAGSSLSEAYHVINGERQDSYGNPEDSFSLIAEFWTTYLRQVIGKNKEGYISILSLDVAHMMTLFKIARMLVQAPCRDNYIDAQGYLAIAADRLLSPSPATGEGRGEGD